MAADRLVSVAARRERSQPSRRERMHRERSWLGLRLVLHGQDVDREVFVDMGHAASSQRRLFVEWELQLRGAIRLLFQRQRCGDTNSVNAPWSKRRELGRAVHGGYAEHGRHGAIPWRQQLPALLTLERQLGRAGC